MCSTECPSLEAAAATTLSVIPVPSTTTWELSNNKNKLERD